jgi:hypothetical protein
VKVGKEHACTKVKTPRDELSGGRTALPSPSKARMPFEFGSHHQYQRKDEKLPLAILIHHNWLFSLIFAVLTGQLAMEKTSSYYFCNTFQRSLLIPTYCVWLMAEIPRLYIGQKGIICDKVRNNDSAVIHLLSFNIQMSIFHANLLSYQSWQRFYCCLSSPKFL